MKNIFVLDKNYKQIGILSNEGANPQAPYYEDLYTQELETGADTYYFSTMSTPYTQDILEIGNHIMFAYKNKYELFTITSLEYSHSEGYKTIGVYAEGIGFELLEVFMKRPENEKENGTDNDNDGDDNYDDEYADVDDLYIDENGNIIYNKYGKEDYADPENVNIDGNGNIIYKRNKNNRKNDSLEFKNISYSRFLSILLKNTGWSYVCQPGLEEVKHDITVRYDTNIYAILQDSMQDYKGVELQFSYSMMGGQVHKIIMAYKNGGRGSFVGNRFEYGVNVKGITKTQEVANSEDDTVYFVDNVGIEVTYDVDFALKSTEVPEIEIGDTHYVIDKDFYPPMTIKARIGKIEISFSDRTKNKIYLANNKKVRGSALGGSDGDSDTVADHTHDRLVKDDKVFTFSENYFLDSGQYEAAIDIGDSTLFFNIAFNDNGEVFNAFSCVSHPDYGAINLFNPYQPMRPDRDGWCDIGSHTSSGRRNRYGESHICQMFAQRVDAYAHNVPFDRVTMQDVSRITDSSDISKKDIYDFIINDVNIYRYFPTEFIYNKGYNVVNITQLGLLSEDFIYPTHDTAAHCILKDVASVIMPPHDSMTYAGDGVGTDPYAPGGSHFYNLPSLVCALISAFQYHVAGGDTGIEVPGDPDNPGSGNYATVSYVDNKLSDYATIEYVDREILEAQLSRDEPVDLSDYATIEYVDGRIDEIKPAVNEFLLLEPGINSLLLLKPDIEKLIADSGGGGTPGTGGSTISGIPIEYVVNETASQYVGESWIQANDDLWIKGNVLCEGMTFKGVGDGFYIEQVDGIVFSDGTSLTTAGSGNNTTFENISIDGQLKILTENTDIGSEGLVVGSVDVPTMAAFFGPVLSHDIIYHAGISHISDKSLKENIRYIDTPTTYSNDDLLEKADLHDFIMNQLNICEYNYIGKDDDKIGLIANDYEGTKVGDKIITRNKETDLLAYDMNNLLFATIGALQEEVRIKNEQIANLESRLAAIEALLSNNDN